MFILKKIIYSVILAFILTFTNAEKDLEKHENELNLKIEQIKKKYVNKQISPRKRYLNVNFKPKNARVNTKITKRIQNDY